MHRPRQRPTPHKQKRQEGKDRGIQPEDMQAQINLNEHKLLSLVSQSTGMRQGYDRAVTGFKQTSPRFLCSIGKELFSHSYQCHSNKASTSLSLRHSSDGSVLTTQIVADLPFSTECSTNEEWVHCGNTVIGSTAYHIGVQFRWVLGE